MKIDINSAQGRKLWERPANFSPAKEIGMHGT